MHRIILFWFSVGCLHLNVLALKITVPEGKTKTISCNHGEVLDIRFAKYEGASIHCVWRNNVTDIVRSQCQGKTSCTLKAKDKYYKDSCFLSDEVLTIRYNCSVPVSSSTLWTLDPNITPAANHTTWPTEGLTDSATDSSSVSWTDNLKFAQPRENMVSHDTNNETITIAVIIAGCIFGLVLVAIMTIAVIRCFSDKKAQISEHVQILQVQMNSIEDHIYCQEQDTSLLTHGQASDDSEYQTFIETSGNISFRLDQNTDQTSPNSMMINETAIGRSRADDTALDRSGAEDTSLGRSSADDTVLGRCSAVDTATTRCKAVNEVEYSSVKRESSDRLPPPYDVVKPYNLFCHRTKHMYNHAYYFGDSYNKTNERLAPCNNTDGYSTPGLLRLDSAKCFGCHRKSEHVYENENIALRTEHKLDLISSNAATSCLKNEHDWSRKSNQYDNIMFTRSKPSGHQNNETVEWNDNRQSQGYMPMNFGVVKDDPPSENVYVPIRSPTALSPSDVVDDTYQP